MAKKDKGNGALQEASEAQGRGVTFPPPDFSGSGATQQPETQPEEQALPVDMSHASHDDGAAEASTASVGETAATEVPAHDEPGPEDFERHSNAKLRADKEADMRLEESIEAELEKVRDRQRRRDDVYAKRIVSAHGKSACVEIGGKMWRPRGVKGGGLGFVAHNEVRKVALE